MEVLTNKEFKNFIKSHGKFYKNITEISKSDFDEPLIVNDFKMYSLDEMCWDCELLKENTPKTTDALWFKESLDGKLTLYIIEFKFHNFNDPNARDMLEIMANDVNDSNLEYKYKCLSEKFKKNLRKIKNYYGDEVEFSLILKPIESLTMVIPALYEQYCIDYNLPQKDIKTFLDNVEKKLIVFISHYDDKKKHNSSKQRVQTMDVGIENNYRRLERGNIIDYHKIYPSFKFSYFLSYERLI
ncbi:hypothetical protein [uncultured Methanobrevibacter sp.]|uniref:hypothetical protein n=1 Tax=uncultured Methanobrevibacter sp. TaxID=253161 RepID=UPI00260903A2|nr:hypothetical protein [uncultured Methanobrevibacter sp.]